MEEKQPEKVIEKQEVFQIQPEKIIKEVVQAQISQNIANIPPINSSTVSSFVSLQTKKTVEPVVTKEPPKIQTQMKSEPKNEIKTDIKTFVIPVQQQKKTQQIVKKRNLTEQKEQFAEILAPPNPIVNKRESYFMYYVILFMIFAIGTFIIYSIIISYQKVRN